MFYKKIESPMGVSGVSNTNNAALTQFANMGSNVMSSMMSGADATSIFSGALDGTIDTISDAIASDCKSDVGKTLIQLGAQVFKMLLGYVIGQAQQRADKDQAKLEQIQKYNDQINTAANKDLDGMVTSSKKTLEEAESQAMAKYDDMIAGTEDWNNTLQSLDADRQTVEKNIMEKAQTKQAQLEEQAKERTKLDALQQKISERESLINDKNTTPEERQRLEGEIEQFKGQSTTLATSIMTRTSNIQAMNNELQGLSEQMQGLQDALIKNAIGAENFSNQSKEEFLSMVNGIRTSGKDAQTQIGVLAGNLMGRNSALSQEQAVGIAAQILDGSTDAAMAATAATAATAESCIPGGQAKAADNFAKATDLATTAGKIAVSVAKNFNTVKSLFDNALHISSGVPNLELQVSNPIVDSLMSKMDSFPLPNTQVFQSTPSFNVDIDGALVKGLHGTSSS